MAHRKLQILDVSSNQLSKLPSTLALNTTLVELHAGHNLIHELDVDVHQWTQLKV
jgi:Leucine-rich repeat (LRR) protein